MWVAGLRSPANCARELMPSLANAFRTCDLTVFGERCSRSATLAFVAPSAMRRRPSALVGETVPTGLLAHMTDSPRHTQTTQPTGHLARIRHRPAFRIHVERVIQLVDSPSVAAHVRQFRAGILGCTGRQNRTHGPQGVCRVDQCANVTFQDPPRMLDRSGEQRNLAAVTLEELEAAQDSRTQTCIAGGYGNPRSQNSACQMDSSTMG